mgnify:CR=1 FL=1
MCGNCFPDVQRYKLIHIPTGYSIYINRLWYMFFPMAGVTCVIFRFAFYI